MTARRDRVRTKAARLARLPGIKCDRVFASGAQSGRTPQPWKGAEGAGPRGRQCWAELVRVCPLACHSRSAAVCRAPGAAENKPAPCHLARGGYASRRCGAGWRQLRASRADREVATGSAGLHTQTHANAPQDRGGDTHAHADTHKRTPHLGGTQTHTRTCANTPQNGGHSDGHTRTHPRAGGLGPEVTARWGAGRPPHPREGRLPARNDPGLAPAHLGPGLAHLEGRLPRQALVHDGADAPQVCLPVVVLRHDDFRGLRRVGNTGQGSSTDGQSAQ